MAIDSRVTARPLARLRADPVAETARLIGKKWFLMILHELTRSPRGFNDLKRAVEGISAKVLSESLTELETRGMVRRRISSESPVRVEYSLTDMGADLVDVFAAMHRWGERWAAPGTAPRF